MTNKKDIRKLISTRKSKHSPSDINNNSKVIIEKLMSTEEYTKANTIFSYVSFNQEVITKELLEGSFRHKNVAVPKIVGSQMIFYYIKSYDDLEEGIKGILEPTTTRVAEPGPSDLFVVPGLAFDSNKNRIGYGKGYYDKYFEKHKAIGFYKTAITFDFQIVPNIPTDDFDVKLDKIITEARVII